MDGGVVLWSTVHSCRAHKRDVMRSSLISLPCAPPSSRAVGGGGGPPKGDSVSETDGESHSVVSSIDLDGVSLSWADGSSAPSGSGHNTRIQVQGGRGGGWQSG
jgi:hypothetical protein